jgi:tetratricopeptide (TPR) repeat protein
MSENAQRVAEVVKSTLEREPEEWPAFLDQECGSDAALRAEVESLLQQHEHATRFIETQALHLAAESLVRDGAFHAGQIIGDYEILSLIGTGGMGEVYLALDRHLNRKAALKFVRRGMDSDDILRRFQHEERLLASLNHPNIAQLYGSGVSADGIPFFAMEYVEGERVDQFCNERRLAMVERLKLFRKVCSAVTYAHQHLVIHRDIKPANIRVTVEGEPKLLDFGIAKLLDAEGGQSSGQTLTLQGVMTPEYASPEQVRGEHITTASDVYSLGVVLYELLTGQRPYRITSSRPDEIARAITEQEPTRPSTAIAKVKDSQKSAFINQKSLRGDLDNIVLVAMRKEPARRYSSVGQFSEDIRRHLEGLPVIARKDTVGYRTAKFVRRNKIGVAAAAIVFVTLVGGIIATACQANRATREAKLAAEQRDRAERRFEDVRHLSNALLFEIAPKIEHLEGATEARQSLLTQSLKYLDSLAQESGKDWALQSELAAAYEKIGDLQGNPTNPNLMVLTDALASYKKANAMRRKLFEKNPKDAEQRRLLANNYRVLGDLHWQTNEPDESLKNSQTALRLYTKLLAEQPGSTELRLGVARATYDIGSLFSTNEKYAEAIPYFQKAIASAEELRRQFPNRLEVLTLLGNTHQQLGVSLSWESKQQEGEAEMARAIEIYEPLVAANPNDGNLPRGLYQTYLITSSVYEGVNDTLANEYAFKALRIAEKTVEKDPASQRPKHFLAMACSKVGVTLTNIGKTAESVSYLEKAVSILQTLAQKETMNRRFKLQLGLALLRLGDARRKQGNFEGAFQDLEKASAMYSDLVARDANDNASVKNLASVNKFLAETHEDLAAKSAAADKQLQVQLARKHLLEARDLLRQLQARSALSDFDRKMLEEIQAAAKKYE